MISSTDTLSQETVRSIKGKGISPEDFTEVELSTGSVSDDTNYSKEGQYASHLARIHSDHFVQTSKSYSATYENALPRLASSEISIGSLLGKGGFSDVFEITSFPLIPNSEEKEDEDQRSSREFLRKHVCREKTGDGRYAVKRLRLSTVNNNELFPFAASDLALERKILCSVLHPNIIKLRGVCSEGELGFRSRDTEGFFLVLDRLDETLDQRINKWKEEGGKAGKKSSKGLQLKKFFGCKTTTVEQISKDKLEIIRDIASALRYLHRRKIIYRDLKPENFGFDVRGDIKLFDFGLSKEISSCEKMNDGTYKLTGGTGSPRYMAPEVVKHETYNLSADVYSFCILLWEMLTLEKPFDGFDIEKHSRLVAYGKYRPNISDSFPSTIQTLLKSGWSSNLHERPSSDEIFKMFLEMTNVEHNSSNHSRLELFAMRSTFKMLRHSQMKELYTDSSRTAG